MAATPEHGGDGLALLILAHVDITERGSRAVTISGGARIVSGKGRPTVTFLFDERVSSVAYRSRIAMQLTEYGVVPASASVHAYAFAVVHR